MRFLRTFLLLTVAVCMTSQARADFINGTFSTGDLTGWTPYVTSNGSTGAGLPDVVSFNTSGGGASLAARFNVGVTAFGMQEGGGISQVLSLAAGSYNLTANFAAFCNEFNGTAGVFSVLVDGVTQDTIDLGMIFGGQTLRSSFNINLNLGAGNHTFAFQVTRAFGQDDRTPYQYYDDLHITGGPTPVPVPAGLVLSSIGMLCIGGYSYRRRRA